MSFGFELVKHAEGPCGTVYSFRKEGEEKSEIQKFWEKSSVCNARDYDALYNRLYDEEEGLLHSDWWEYDFNLRHSPDHNPRPEDQNWLRDESDDVTDPDHPNYYAEALWAPIPVKDRRHLTEPYPSLRLYLFQIPEKDPPPRYTAIFVVGNGDVKDVDQPHQKLELQSALDDIRYVMNRVYERIEWQERLTIVERGYLLDGNRRDFYFEPKHQP